MRSIKEKTDKNPTWNIYIALYIGFSIILFQAVFPFIIKRKKLPQIANKLRVHFPLTTPFPSQQLGLRNVPAAPPSATLPYFP